MQQTEERGKSTYWIPYHLYSNTLEFGWTPLSCNWKDHNSTPAETLEKNKDHTSTPAETLEKNKDHTSTPEEILEESTRFIN